MPTCDVNAISYQLHKFVDVRSPLDLCEYVGRHDHIRVIEIIIDIRKIGSDGNTIYWNL